MLLCEDKCYARIGETLEQCEKRYGKRITDKHDIKINAIWMLGKNSHVGISSSGAVEWFHETHYFFRLDKYVICLKFDKGKVDEIKVSKPDKYSAQPLDMSSEEIDAIVSANTKIIKCHYFISDSKVLIILTEEYRTKLENKIDGLKKEVDDIKKEREKLNKNVLKKF